MVRALATLHSQPQEQCNLRCDKKLMPYDRRFLLHKNVDLPSASNCRTNPHNISSLTYYKLRIIKVWHQNLSLYHT